jgi:dolichol-phosphate mannosyltransferase
MAVPRSAGQRPELADSVGAGPHVAVVIPAYRVANHIETVLRGIPSSIETVVVVDDASPDDVAARVLAIDDPRVLLVRHEQNGGVGAAVLTGYRAALDRGADMVVKMDGDDQMDPRYIPLLVLPVARGEADYVKGNRFLHLSNLEQMPVARRLGNIILSLLTKVASGYWDIFDPTNGYTVIGRDALQLLDEERVAKRWFFETSMIIELGLLRAVVRDVYVPARYPHADSSLSIWAVLRQFPGLLFSAALRRFWLQHIVREFSATAVFLLAGSLAMSFGLLWGSYHWWLSALNELPASTGTVMLAVLPIMTGLQLVLQALILDMQSVPRVALRRSSAQAAGDLWLR